MKTITMKNNLLIMPIVLICTMGFTSCKKGSNSPAPDPTPNPGNTNVTGLSIYVAGYEYDATGTIPTAEYWKNGVAVKLSDGKNLAQAFTIFVSGNDVYVAGAELINGKAVAKYWKNGTGVNLPDNLDAEGLSVAVNGNDVYVSGFETKADGSVSPKYWKNGVGFTLPTGGTSGVGQATEMTIAKNGDVYIVGQAEGKGVYWKNGILVNVPGTDDVYAVAVGQSNDVYLACKPTVNSTLIYAGFWNNGSLSNLYDGNNNCAAYSVALNSGYAFIGGHTISGGRQYVVYWRNGVITKVSDGSTDAELGAIALYGSDIYCVGTIKKANGNNAPVYWKNNMMTSLTGVPGSASGQATSIVIQ